MIACITSQGVVVAGVLMPRIVHRQHLAHLVAQRRQPAVSSVDGELLSGLGTWALARLEETPSRQTAEFGTRAGGSHDRAVAGCARAFRLTQVRRPRRRASPGRSPAALPTDLTCTETRYAAQPNHGRQGKRQTATGRRLRNQLFRNVERLIERPYAIAERESSEKNGGDFRREFADRGV